MALLGTMSRASAPAGRADVGASDGNGEDMLWERKTVLVRARRVGRREGRDVNVLEEMLADV